MPVHEPEGHIIKTAGIDFFESSKQPILLAENEQKTASEESKPQTDDRDQPIDTGEKSIEKNGKAEIEAPKKPLKPFKPSEEIAAEQAVDFPWDI